MPALILIIPLLACWWDQSHHDRNIVYTPKTAMAITIETDADKYLPDLPEAQ